ncbi:transcription repressor OFP7-like [Oryza brachyantha]|uniref:transcription repressor OFP7-like n=1 Tax=Oryza brachyantha TaxID=4533 RepID=UPI001ADA92DB|nr:transcription repressor OFP7-like [Oryza brachyantha]
MAKRLFHSCRSPSAADAVVTSTCLLASDHQSVVTGSAGQCRIPRRRPQPPGGCGAADYATGDIPPPRGPPAYRWLKSSQWHVIEVAGVTDDDHTPRLKIDARRRLRRSRRRHHHRLHRRADPASGSSGDSGWFTSDEDSYANSCGVGGEAETLVASTTTESSSGASGNCGGGEADGVVVDGSFAVIKRSDDPRADFRQSMAEMVVGRAIYDADGLERLLRCFLALNHQRHRRDIVAAFGDVWEAVFSCPTSRRGVVTSDPAIRKAAATVSNRP